jgi:hypothetical protein
MTKEYKNLLRFDYSAEAIGKETENLINKSRKLQDHVAVLPENERNFKNVIMALAYDESEFGTLENNLTFPGRFIRSFINNNYRLCLL